MPQPVSSHPNLPLLTQARPVHDGTGPDKPEVHCALGPGFTNRTDVTMPRADTDSNWSLDQT